MNRTHYTVLLGLLTISLAAVAGVSGIGAVSAQETTNTTSWDETLDVDNDTEAVRATALNTSAVLDVTVYSVNSAGNETEVANGTLDAPSGTDAFEYSNLNTTAYDQYRVNVTGGEAETVEIARIQVQTGVGGGGMLPSSPDVGTAGQLVGGGVLVVLVGGLIAVGSRRY
ncbi:hypothetical protein [Halovenus marina]|uniref:hypothetical protein n=1 Tax=Halovenus marina TaxID=3396621 RepID=UPI003F5559C8